MLSFLLLLFSNGKSYYLFPIILTILPFAGIFWEQKVIQNHKWVLFPITFLLFSGSVLISFGMPVYTFNHYLHSIYKFEKKDIDGVKYDEYYTQ
jgi:hypothetical protein